MIETIYRPKRYASIDFLRGMAILTMLLLHAVMDTFEVDKYVNELSNRKMDKIPHPTISESLELLGKKRINDPEIYFIHLNHTNPANDETSIQRKKIDSMGWGVVLQGSIFSI